MKQSELGNKYQLTTAYRLQWEKVQNAHVLLYPEGMVQLNPSAAEILLLCTGEHSVAEMITQ